MWPVLVQLLPNTVEKTLLEDSRFFPHDGEGRERWGGRGGTLWPFPVERICTTGVPAFRAGLGVMRGEAHVSGTNHVLIFTMRINLSV